MAAVVAAGCAAYHHARDAHGSVLVRRPLFHFDVHDDVRVGAYDHRVEKDESHAGKVMEKRVYERLKEKFPYSRFEIYDPSKKHDECTCSALGLLDALHARAVALGPHRRAHRSSMPLLDSRPRWRQTRYTDRRRTESAWTRHYSEGRTRPAHAECGHKGCAMVCPTQAHNCMHCRCTNGVWGVADSPGTTGVRRLEHAAV